MEFQEKWKKCNTSSILLWQTLKLFQNLTFTGNFLLWLKNASREKYYTGLLNIYLFLAWLVLPLFLVVVLSKHVPLPLVSTGLVNFSISSVSLRGCKRLYKFKVELANTFSPLCVRIKKVPCKISGSKVIFYAVLPYGLI